MTTNKNLKLFLICLFILTLGASGYAQSTKHEAGIEGGPSLIFLRGNEILEEMNKPTIGFSAGLSYQYNFKKIFSLRTNIAFERKGSVADADRYNELGEKIGEFKIHTNYEYLTLPILLRATFGKKTLFFVNAGPYIGYLLNQTFVAKLADGSKTSYNNTSRDEDFDYGISTGLGISIPIQSKFALSFEIRNNLGLYNISDVPVYHDGTIKTNSTNLLCCLTYKLGEKTSDVK